MEEHIRNVELIKGGQVIIEVFEGKTPRDFTVSINDFVLRSNDIQPVNEFEFTMGVAAILQEIALTNREELEGRLMPRG